MKALVKTKAAPDLTLTDVPKPEIGAHDVLIKVQKTSLCGTDIHIYQWDEWAERTIPVPVTTGHEYMGIIAEVGSEVTHYKVGQRVTGEGHIICNQCRQCRAGRRHHCAHTKGIGVTINGAFAEYVRLPAENVIALPDSVPDEIAAIFDPLGNAVHTALSFDLVGEDVLITGAGPIGIMASAICRHAGARHVVITDMHPYRLDLARKMGAADYVMNAAEENLSDVIAKLNLSGKYTVGLEMSGNGTALDNMIDAMAHGGKIALLGILPNGTGAAWEKIVFKSLTLKGIYGREMYETWHKMQAMIESGLNVAPIITHHFKASDYEQAFATMATGQSGKIILHWDEF